MAAPTQRESPDRLGLLDSRRSRWILLALVALLVGGIVWAAVSDSAEDEEAERFDVLAKIRHEFEPRQDALWMNPHGAYNSEREEYIAALEKFLEKRAQPVGGVLEAQTRYYIARAAADHILSNPELFDLEKRQEAYRKAREHLSRIVESHPEFPLNWTTFAQGDAPTLARQFLAWIDGMQAWDEKYLPRAVSPTGTHTIVIRTDRADLRVRLYEKELPEESQDLIERLASGALDGGHFVSKREMGEVEDPQDHTLRAAPVTSAQAYDRAAAAAIEKSPVPAAHLPAATRNTTLHVRGTVSFWHPEATEYDDPSQLLFVVRDSPLLNYEFTPIGRIEDPASLAGLDRIFAEPVWRDDKETNDSSEWNEIRDYLQTPVRIVKVLVFDAEGRLVEPKQALERRVAPTDAERTLSGLVADAYKVERPVRPPVPGGTANGGSVKEEGE
jgi:hypothetical protein